MTDGLSSNKLAWLLVTALALLSTGCTQRPKTPPSPEISLWTVRLDVPFVAQAERNDCGPAALAAVLRYYGQDIDLATISRQVLTPKLGRTLLADMENYAARLGFQTRSGSGSPELIKESLDTGTPIIALLNLGPTFLVQGHYVVIYAYTQDGFLAHLGTSSSVYLSEKELCHRWQPMNYLYLGLEP